MKNKTPTGKHCPKASILMVIVQRFIQSWRETPKCGLKKLTFKTNTHPWKNDKLKDVNVKKSDRVHNALFEKFKFALFRKSEATSLTCLFLLIR